MRSLYIYMFQLKIILNNIALLTNVPINPRNLIFFDGPFETLINSSFNRMFYLLRLKCKFFIYLGAWKTNRNLKFNNISFILKLILLNLETLI